jgi:RNA-dependent RNA polymerase
MYELARLISSSKLSYEDISSENLNKLTGSNVQSAPKTVRTFFPDATSDTYQDAAFAQEIAAKVLGSPSWISVTFSLPLILQSPWEQLDKEEQALSQDPYAGLGHSQAFPGWYGGKIGFTGKLHRDKGSYKIVLERCALGPSCRFTRRFGSKNFLRIKIPEPILHSADNRLIDFFRKPFVLWGSVFRSFYAKDETVFLFRTNEVMMGNEIKPNGGPGISLLEFLDWHNPPLHNSKQVCLLSSCIPCTDLYDRP